jgi:lysozyme
MKTGPHGISLIKQEEKFMARAYLCPAQLLTIGYGHVIQENEAHLKTAKLTEPEASALLAKDLGRYESAVTRATESARLTQQQFDACVSLCYNIGTGGFAGSSVARLISARASEKAIRTAFEAWCKVTVAGEKKVMPGLLARRKREADLYFSK